MGEANKVPDKDDTKSIDFDVLDDSLDDYKKKLHKSAVAITRGRQRRLGPVIKDFKASMDVAFSQQAKKVIKAIDRLQKDINPFDIEALWSLYDIGEVIISQADKWVRIAIDKGIDGARTVTNINIGFDSNSPRIKNAANDILGKLKSMTDKTSVEDLRGIITDSIQKQETVDQLKRKISERFTQYQGYRSERIARTEAANAYGRASLEYYKEAGITKKQWYTMNDDRVAEICYGNQYEGAIDIHQSFSSGVQNEPNHVNCRCSVVPVSE
jgi:SPP1 gp7 family putative phage head morphogenesis protein